MEWLAWIWRGMMAAAMVIVLVDRGGVGQGMAVWMPVLAVACLGVGFHAMLARPVPAARSGTGRSA